MGSFFTGIEKAQTYGASQYLKPGQYTLTVDNVSVIDSKRTPGRRYFLVEFCVVATDSDYYKEGDTVSWMVDLSRADTAFPNIKGFAVALLDNINEDEVTSEAMDALISDDQPARGLSVCANAFEITTRAGNPFTKVVWSAHRATAPAVADVVPF